MKHKIRKTKNTRVQPLDGPSAGSQDYKKVRFFNQTSVTDLFTGNGRIAGVTAGDKEGKQIRAKAKTVVI
jgi:hypothetical protein